MAYLLLSHNNTVTLLAKRMEELEKQVPAYVQYQNGLAGKMLTISDEEFSKLQSGQQFTYENNTLNFSQEYFGSIYETEEVMKAIISKRIERIDEIYPKYKDIVFGNELTAYKAVLSNLDTSTFTYPYNQSLEKHLLDQGTPVVSTLQMV